MPSAWASWGRLIWTSRPSHSMTPLSAGPTPEITLMSVDLPAPLSPTRATTSPARICSSTSTSACTPPNRLETPRNASTGGNATGDHLSLPGESGLVAGGPELRNADLVDRVHALPDHGLPDVGDL